MNSREYISEIATRLWLHLTFVALSAICAIGLIVFSSILCVLLFENKSRRKMTGPIAVILSALLCAFICFMCLGTLLPIPLLNPNCEKIGYENGTKYVYEKYGVFDVEIKKYQYINWFIRSNENLNYRPDG